MATTLQLKRCLRDSLPATKTPGAVYLVLDERAIYHDVNANTRVRFGDYQEFPDLESLKKNTNPSTTALYYIESDNILAKFNGTDYIQINPDTGADGVELDGTEEQNPGNVITSIEYDETSRKLKIKKEYEFTLKTDHDALATLVGEIPNTAASTNIVDYITEVANAAVAAADHISRKKVASVDAIDPAAANADRYIYMVPNDETDENGKTYRGFVTSKEDLEGVLNPHEGDVYEVTSEGNRYAYIASPTAIHWTSASSPNASFKGGVATKTSLDSVENPADGDIYAVEDESLACYVYDSSDASDPWKAYTGTSGGFMGAVADTAALAAISSPADGDTYAVQGDSYSQYEYDTTGTAEHWQEYSGTSNLYLEYMVLDGKVEKVGKWAVDLSDYPTIEDLDDKLDNYSTTTDSEATMDEKIEEATEWTDFDDFEGF